MNIFGKNARVRTEVVAGTAGNTVLSLGPTTGMMGKVVMAQVILTTDATVANRRVIMTVKDADGNALIDVHSGAVVAASQTNQHHEFMQGIFRETSFIGNALQVPIPLEMIIPLGGTVEINIENGQAGDDYDVSFLGYEW